MIVCIAEKPSVAREIAKVLGANQRDQGFYKNADYCVTWVFGHLCELKEPHDYDDTLRRWDFRMLPILPQKFGIKLRDDSGVKKQFHIIKDLISKAAQVINCGDAGQEGELIQRWVMQMAKTTCPVKRLWISSLTEEAIKEGFDNLKPGNDFDNLYAAGSARAIGDWLLGMNATRAYTIRYGGQGMVLSIGRVQTPTLALIVDRFKEIQNFKPEKYWELKTTYRDVVFAATHGRFNTIEEGQQALAEIQDTPFQITDTKTKKGKEAPPRLYDLTSLQVECNKKLSFSADETLRIAQSLYEQKLTTYPRVDTTFLTDDIYPKVPAILKGLTPYAQLTAPLLASKIAKPSRIFNNLKVTDHHAIIPTGMPPLPSLSISEKRVYDLVARRFIANFYPDCEFLQTTVLGKAGKVEFKATGKQILKPGWREVYGNQNIDTDNSKEDNKILPQFTVGESGPHQPSLREGQTQPPKLYTEATLLRAMETAGKQVDNDELRDLMKDNGIGRPSTRAAIIETLFKRKYIIKNKNSLIPTANGIRLIDTISSPMLKSVELTGQWEKKLRQIENGQYTAAEFISEMKGMVTDVVSKVGADLYTQRFTPIEQKSPKESKTTQHSKQQQQAAQQQTEESMTCPKCGKKIIKGKTAWGCSGYKEGCNFKLPFTAMGKKLTDKQALALLTKGKTAVIKGLEVDGEKTDGSLFFDNAFNLLVKTSSTPKADIDQMSCPLCGGRILQGKQAWGCSNYAQGCHFVVPYVFMGKKLTLTHLNVITKKRRTATISGFIDENGVRRSGSLVVTPNGSIALEA